MDNIEAGVTLAIDITPLKEKISQLITECGALSFESIEKQLPGCVASLLDDIIFCELSTTVSTDGVLKVVQRVDFGPWFEHTLAALRA
ncbi:hypothetical protein NTH60_000904 [Enterobacter ludwigii]|nr:hypothetical protein [Enterobacter ludwigii]